MVIWGALIAFGVGIIPALIWLAFFLREDIHPEPKRLILYTFSVGALASVPALGLQILFQNFVVGTFHGVAVLVFGLALIEEAFKFFAAYWAVHNSPAFDEPVDAMVYMIVAALGFATIENLFIVGGMLGVLNAASVGNAVETVSIRLVGATLLHVVSSAIVGYYWAMGQMRRRGSTVSSSSYRIYDLKTLQAFVPSPQPRGSLNDSSSLKAPQSLNGLSSPSKDQMLSADGKLARTPTLVGGGPAAEARRETGRWIVAGLAIATVVHALFNLLVLRFQSSNLIYPSLFLIVAVFFVLNDFEKLKAAFRSRDRSPS